MAQIQRVALFPHATFHIALARVFGLGKSTSLAVSEACGISKDLKVKDVKDSYIQKVTAYIEANFVTGDTLKRQVRENVLEEVAINSRRGVRHTLGLPVSSAQTRSNGVNARKLRPLLLYDTSRR
ncbi:hypothetical protein CHLRE_16g674350v5 [Chlamydomonas reinhardtii]|uniref:Uncharacterized protein n=1 Tax=Chlamydomonas reinhardtii TaxID=3055 RepID=A8J3J1_CHLRE|nr:uncharacterized protein CHLRE_16g674350v5 [Chlamydomonas reinhardtii]PNW72289.1 hypothetical protein CHLRE_16g674350v5 [Chlamydomonas reinhardtii]7PKQ_m Chain m, Mitochondrial ribosomal protein S13 [Chlamydomonas reinhardtii]|eukprot:XP_001695933.1 mitochondrial ribosomal protein S13 [Chlamydomonas reinhardtii]